MFSIHNMKTTSFDSIYLVVGSYVCSQSQVIAMELSKDADLQVTHSKFTMY